MREYFIPCICIVCWGLDQLAWYAAGGCTPDGRKWEHQARCHEKRTKGTGTFGPVRTFGDHAGPKGSAGRAWITVHMDSEDVKAQGFSFWVPPWRHQFKLFSCHSTMIKGTKYLGLCYRKKHVVKLERETSLTVKMRWVGSERRTLWVTGAACGEGASVPAVEVWGGTTVTSNLPPEWSHWDVSLTWRSFTSFMCSIFQIMPYIRLYPAQILLWYF